MKKKKSSMYNKMLEYNCVLCGKKLILGVTSMTYNPKNPKKDEWICHPSCRARVRLRIK